MGTLTEEIFSRRLGREVHAGEIVVAPVDYAMAHDVTGPLAIEAFRKLDVPLWDPERVIMVFDHILPANTVASAGLHKIVRDFADEYGVTHVFQEGICHQLMVEKGFIRPGGIVVGADSHSTTYGALGCFSAGFGSTDIAVTFATGRTWFRIPETIRINLRGELRQVTGDRHARLAFCACAARHSLTSDPIMMMAASTKNAMAMGSSRKMWKSPPESTSERR